MRNPSFSYSIRILAGVYLIYTAYTLGKAYFNGEAGVVMLLAAVLFALCAAAFIVTGIKGMSAAQKASKEEAEEEASQPEPEPLPGKKSIGERARMTANLEEEPLEGTILAEEPLEETHLEEEPDGENFAEEIPSIKEEA